MIARLPVSPTEQKFAGHRRASSLAYLSVRTESAHTLKEQSWGELDGA
jgi:hypothetical protein